MCGDLDLLTVAHHDCNVGGHRDQLSERCTGLVHRAGFESVTDREEERHGGSFPEVADEYRAERCNRYEQVDTDELYEQCPDGLHDDSVPRDNCCGEHERVRKGKHMTRTVGVFASVDPPLRTDRDVPAADEELFDAKRHENEEARDNGNEPVAIPPLTERVHECAAFRIDELSALGTVWLERGGLRLIAGLIDSSNEIVDGTSCLIVVDLNATRGEVHRHVLDAIELADLLLDLGHARRARETLGAQQSVGDVSSVRHDESFRFTPKRGSTRRFLAFTTQTIVLTEPQP